ncbi:response regulator [Oscillochloris sp. ZM17-4]|uniref:response regulator n=1 Tax=Oscillochloris sp. ZM17-4 TaxID=2866714 RepID=UPI001C72E61A|nr:response regulator [Oscillochloris sp. ZM17-4]MBX0328125.1 response regulator [Oscillochloris sp. ZM17-4]
MQSFSARFEELRQSYVVQLAEKAAQMADDWKKVEAGAAHPATLAGIQQVAHNLAGTGSTFGFPQVSATAHGIEAALRQIMGGDGGDMLRVKVRDLIHSLQQIVAGVVDPAPAGDMPSAPATAAVAHIYFLCTDADEGTSIAAQVANFGYETHVFSHIDELQATAQAATPDALVLDIAFLEHADIRDSIDRLRHLQAVPVPLIVIASHGDFAARLHAVRSGGNAYFTRPIDVGTLVDQLDRLTEHRRSDPYHVLIVDDSRLVADTYAIFLSASGIHTTVITDPTVVSEKLHDLKPDLILMDMYMPGCEGRELAAVLRQQPELHSIPIVYLSAEMDRGTQLAAMDEGGDDFLTKPINPGHLVAAVTSRIRRARVMRSQMLRDSLTGLFNHSVTEDMLAREVSRARRNKRPFSMGLLDLDHFKQVNDRYGHAAGDRVLKSLARLLQQRLRISDLIGRYGGEEFVVLMPETDEQGAFNVLDAIRERFAQVRHRSGDAEFSVTLSGGVSSLQSSDDATTLSESADTALYQAKHHGRDQIVLATRNLLRNDVTFGQAPATVIESTMILGVQAHVLVVDDDPYVRDMLKHWLGSANYDVQFASLGREALTMVPKMNPDLVLLDVLMPDVDGLEVLDLLRSSGCDAAVVLTTAYGSERIAVNAMRRGADDYLRKPIQAEELQTVLNRNLERLRLRRQNSALQHQLEEQRQKLDLELARAGRVQMDLLPRQMPRLPGFTLAARCIPSSLVGGDFYDWHSPGPGLLNLTFGDVMGKGMPAALLMTTVRAVMRSVGRQTPPLVNLRYALTALDSDLNNARAFVTMFHAQLDLVSRRLSFIDAGHGLVFVRRAGGGVETLSPRGVPLGVPSREPYAQGEVQLNPGDALILFSDGLLDTWPALADNHLILAELLSDDVQAPAMVERILALPALVGSVIDDLTVVALSCTAE